MHGDEGARCRLRHGRGDAKMAIPSPQERFPPALSFLLPCPNCGPRAVNEFVCAGEVTQRPARDPSPRELAAYVYFRRNVAGVQREWWFHRLGCEAWFQAERDTRTNEVLLTERLRASRDEAPPGPEAPALPDTPAA